jgi:hypothetical protein
VANIFGQAAFDVKVTKRFGQPNFLQMSMQSWYFWYKYRGLPVNDVGKIILWPIEEPNLIPFAIEFDIEL